MDDGRNELKLSEEIKRKLQNETDLKHELRAGRIPQEILEFSDELMAQLYECAYSLFEQRRFEEASDAFVFLSTLNPNHYGYWLGLGMSLQMIHQYEPAIDAYELAALIDLESPVPYFYLAKCLFAIHDRQSSLEALEMALEMAGDEEDYEELREQALQARDLLLKSEQNEE